MPVITQCSIRHLYTLADIPSTQKETLIALAKTFERRRCNHHTLDQPLSTLECLSSVIDSKNSRTNKNRYVVATQDEAVRRYCREVRGVPLVYVKRSVMVMEPMAEGSVGVREGVEREKFRAGLKGRVGKRKRGDDDEGREGDHSMAHGETAETKKKRVRGPKGPNPLSVKKAKKVKMEEPPMGDNEQDAREVVTPNANEERTTAVAVDIREGPSDESQNLPTKRKRRRKHKPNKIGDLVREIEMDRKVDPDE